MALKNPTPGLRVFHNSNTAQKFTITVPAGADLVVPLEVAAQMNAESSHAEVDGLDHAKADAAEANAPAEREAAETAHREYHRIDEEKAAFLDENRFDPEKVVEAFQPTEKPAKPKRAAKKSAPDA